MPELKLLHIYLDAYLREVVDLLDQIELVRLITGGYNSTISVVVRSFEMTSTKHLFQEQLDVLR